MTYRTFRVGHGKDRGFVLYLREHSSFWDGLMHAGEWVEEKVFHHLACNSRPMGWLHDQAYRRERDLAEIPIDRETADKLALSPDTWSWLDEDESLTEEEKKAQSRETIEHMFEIVDLWEASPWYSKAWQYIKDWFSYWSKENREYRKTGV